jgi:carbon-monoxide dehydrogenase medium subunit
MPGPKANSAGAYLRFIPRNEMDIAVVGVGVQIALDETLKRCTAARVALGAVAPTPLLVPAAGAALLAGEFNESAMDQAAAAAQAAAKPITDMRGTAEYRKHLVGILVKRALQQAFGRIQQAASKKKPLSSSASKEPSTDQPTTPPEPHAPQES